MGMQLHLSTPRKADRKHFPEAFTVVELLIVVACLSILAAIILPSMARQNCAVAQKINCTNNLKQIGICFSTWALDHNDQNPMQVSLTNGGAMEMVATGTAFAAFLVMSNELSTPKILLCPEEND